MADYDRLLDPPDECDMGNGLRCECKACRQEAFEERADMAWDALKEKNLGTK